MRITTWNVNGFRAVLKKEFKGSIEKIAPDILCLQEIKAKDDQLTPEEKEITGYTRYWNSADQPGYSGVATYIKNSLLDTINEFGFGVPEFDVEGRVISTAFKNVILYNIYFPNGQRGQERVDYKLNFYATLLEKCIKENRNIIITGDFNTAHNEIDLANPKENSKTSGFLPEERAWVTKFIDNGFIDAYRYLYPDKIQYTWWTYRFGARKRNIGWRLDYYLVSNSFLSNIKDVIIHDEIVGSDHCPVSIEINDNI